MNSSHILARLNAATELPTLRGMELALGRICTEQLTSMNVGTETVVVWLDKIKWTWYIMLLDFTQMFRDITGGLVAMALLALPVRSFLDTWWIANTYHEWDQHETPFFLSAKLMLGASTKADVGANNRNTLLQEIHRFNTQTHSWRNIYRWECNIS